MPLYDCLRQCVSYSLLVDFFQFWVYLKIASFHRFLTEGTSFISPPESRIKTSPTMPTPVLVEENGVLVEKLVYNPVEREWCFTPNSIDAKVSHGEANLRQMLVIQNASKMMCPMILAVIKIDQM